MAALAADLNISVVGTPESYKFSANGADVFYKGAVVFVDAVNGGVQVVPANGDYCLGISPIKQTTTAAGDEVEVLIKGFVWMPVGSNVTAADEGDRCVLNVGTTQSDNVADFEAAGDITPAASDPCLGRILRATASQMLLAIDAGGVTGDLYVATAGWGG